MRDTRVKLRYLLRPREIVERPELTVLSVYRDYGVIPKNSRSDNFNKTPLDLSRYQEVRPGDLVVNKMKAWQGSLAVSPHHGIVSPDYLVCSISPSVDPRYLHYLLRSLPLISEYKRRSKGIRPAQWRLYWEDLADISVTLPCVEEQRRIADFLDAEIPRMDRIGRLRKAQQAALNERLSAIVSEYLLPGILTRPSGDGTWPWLPEPPSGQPLVRLGYVCWLQNGLTVEGAREMKGDVVTRPYLRVANVQAGRVNLDSVIEITVPRAIAARSTLRPGDVLMTEGGDLDKLGRGTVWQGEIPDCLHQNHVFALRPDPDKLDGDYLALLTQSLHGRCYFESTGVKTTNLASTNSSKILNFPIPLPTLAAQRQTVTKLRVHMQATNQVLRAIDRQNALLAERRQVLITAAVTGQMDVTTARRVTA